MIETKNSRVVRAIPLLIAVCLVSFPAKAKYGGGSGEPNDPYLIYMAEQMIAISQNVEDWDKHFRLTADLDLTGIDMANYTSIGGYQIVGDDYIKIPFQGVFDGNDHSITGFTYRGENNVGLFGIVDGGANIKGLKLIDPNVGGARKVGVLMGRVYQATVTRCRVQGGKVYSIYEDPKTYLSESIGGLIGQNVAGVVTDCHTTCDVPSERSEMGGLIGENQGTIQDCSATGTIGRVQSTQGHTLGGLVGKNKGSITGCFATGSVSGNGNIGGLVGSNYIESDQQLTGVISACYATGSVSGTEISVGGLVGYNAGTISGCYAAGQVNGKEEVGGLAGSNGHPNSRGEIADCYATGSVTGQSAVGGLVGANPGTVSNCYATGPVSGGVDVGGCIGRNSYYLPGKADGTVTACFWNHDTSGRLYSDGGFGKSTNQMQDPNTYLDAGWDLVGETVNDPNEIWYMSAEVLMYPKLAWEPEPMPFITFDLNEDPNWAAMGLWQFGKPAGQGGSEHGHPDPNRGYTGENVYGVNLAGDFSIAQTDWGPFYLTTNAIDCSNYHNIQVQFARWLNTDIATYIWTFVDVSNDNKNWHTIWEHSDTIADLTDDSWQIVTYDISAYANKKSTVYISWGYEILGQDAWAYSGWNIDDIKLLGIHPGD